MFYGIGHLSAMNVVEIDQKYLEKEMAKKLSCLKNNKNSSWLEMPSKKRASKVIFELLAILREASRVSKLVWVSTSTLPPNKMAVSLMSLKAKRLP